MSEQEVTGRVRFERTRTGWDIALGMLAVAAGLVVLGHVVIASVVSILFTGWMLIAAGAVVLVWGLAGPREPGHWWGFASGAALLLLGLAMVRFPGESLLVFTLLAGSLLLLGGLVRVVAAFQPNAPRGLLLLSGAATLLLAGLILAEFPVSATWYLGTMLGVSLIIDGISAALSGRYRAVASR